MFARRFRDRLVMAQSPHCVEQLPIWEAGLVAVAPQPSQAVPPAMLADWSPRRRRRGRHRSGSTVGRTETARRGRKAPE